jgi:hypothetical protein
MIRENVVPLGSKRAKPAPESPEWLDKCLAGDTGKPLAVLANALIALREAMPSAFAYDEMLCVPMLMHSLVDEDGFTQRPCTDVDVGIVQEKLQHLGLKRVTKDVVHQAVDVRAHECRFHPIKDFLDALEWDQTPRLAGLFPTYFGTPRCRLSKGDRNYVRHQHGCSDFRSRLQGGSSPGH